MTSHIVLRIIYETINVQIRHSLPLTCVLRVVVEEVVGRTVVVDVVVELTVVEVGVVVRVVDVLVDAEVDVDGLVV